MLGRCRKLTPKPSNIAELKTALLSIWNDLPQEFIDKAILPFQKRLDFRVLLQLVDILNITFSLNVERALAADIHHWNVWIVDENVLQNLIRYYWKFRTRLRFHLKKWTLKFKLLCLLNHIYVISMKFAEYVAWILFFKRCKFGEEIYSNARDTEFFLWDYFIIRPRYLDVTDRRREGRTIRWSNCDGITALCVASRGK